jgi:hypothetical protein
MQLSSGVALVCRAEDDERSIWYPCFPLQWILIHLLFLAARCALPPPPLDQTQMRRVRTFGFHTAWVRAYASPALLPPFASAGDELGTGGHVHCLSAFSHGVAC